MTLRHTVRRAVPLLALSLALAAPRAVIADTQTRGHLDPRTGGSVSSTLIHSLASQRAAHSDYNGDGYADLAVGSFGETVDGKHGAGSVNVIYGSASGLQTTGTGGPNDQYWTESSPGMPGHGAGASDGFGSSDEPGDFNGDGYADLAIGVRGDTCGTIGAAGSAIVLYGGPAGLTTDGSQYWNQDSPGVKDQCDKGDHLASSLGHGDFNNDGFDDLAMGADFEGFNTLDKAGAVNVLYGSATGLQAGGSSGPDDQFWSLNSRGVAGTARSGDRFGRQVASGDFNADGYGDLAINADFKMVGTVNHAGTVSVLYGSATGLQATGTGGPDDQMWSEATKGMGTGGAQSDDRFGAAIAAGDLNADGYSDLVSGIRLKDVGSNVDAGALSIIYGSATGLQDKGNGGPDDQFWTQDDLDGPGAQADAWFGYSVSVGNFDGDGFPDVVISARFEDVGTVVDAGAVNVMNGSATGLTATGNQYWNQDSTGILDQAETDDEFGLWNANGDFNGDGADDSAITVWLEDVGTVVDAGAANILYGSVGTGLTSTGNQFINQATPGIEGQGAQTGAEFGWENGAS
jgi:hypothetical protein